MRRARAGGARSCPRAGSRGRRVRGRRCRRGRCGWPRAASAGVVSLSRKPLAPCRIAVAARSSRLKVVRTTTRTGRSRRATRSRAKICRVASTPSISGIRMSMRTTSGSSSSTCWTASRPLPAVPTTAIPACASMMTATPSRKSSWSSTSRTRIRARRRREVLGRLAHGVIVPEPAGHRQPGRDGEGRRVDAGPSADVEPPADGLQPLTHAGPGREPASAVGASGSTPLLHLEPQLPGEGVVRPEPLDADRGVAGTVAHRVRQHLLQHPEGHASSSGGSGRGVPELVDLDVVARRRGRRRRGCRARPRCRRGRRPRRAAPAARRASEVARRAGDRSPSPAEPLGVVVRRYCPDSAWARMTASEWPTTSWTSRASRASPPQPGDLAGLLRSRPPRGRTLLGPRLLGLGGRGRGRRSGGRGRGATACRARPRRRRRCRNGPGSRPAR